MKLYPHQVEGLRQTAGKSNCALYWDMGLGKTYGGSEKMVEYGNRMNLVICQKSKVQDWVNHFGQYDRVTVFDLTKPHKIEQMLDCKHVCQIIGIINYELAWRRPVLKEMKNFTLLLDESSLIQNKQAKQTKFILSLNPNNTILLSGTPTAGKYENLWTQAHLLGWDITEELYAKQYINWEWIQNGDFFHKIVNRDNPYKNVERLKRKFREHGAVFMKTEEVFDLPGQTFTTVSPPTPKEYRKFMRDGIVTLADGMELIGDQVFSKRLYARQLCGMYNKAKFEAFRDLLESTNDRVIVFYNFTAELEKMLPIVSRDCDRTFSIVNGTVKDLTAYERDEDSVTFIQYQAGAMGLNLQNANKVIYFSLPERSDLFEQSKARIHRIGQERPCFYWLLICPGSVEEVIYQTLQERKDFTDDLFVETCC